ncbi:uncharacterized protein FIBRA_07880 [Fibroporia radiculosa]|uniref:Dicer-like protein 1 n=1 Tax=Fibroporia radiculosa TaxID=599839 RepID=J4GVS6_9APHY|nr:uncharacterized protein FIBRA_07880 [Fibroporia radiculosa]CCM05650.1 predicted protein [Fibroporia radiculosa]
MSDIWQRPRNKTATTTRRGQSDNRSYGGPLITQPDNSKIGMQTGLLPGADGVSEAVSKNCSTSALNDIEALPSGTFSGPPAKRRRMEAQPGYSVKGCLELLSYPTPLKYLRHTEVRVPTLQDCVTEIVVEYDHSERAQPPDIALHRLSSIDHEGIIRPRLYRLAQEVHTELGLYGSSYFWKLTLEDMIQKLGRTSTPIDQARTMVEQKAMDRLWTDFSRRKPCIPCLDVASDDFNVSPKFLKLVELIETNTSPTNSFRVLVLVKRKIVASMIVELLRELAAFNRVRNVRPEAMTQAQYMDQELTFDKFVRGDTNILLITKSSEHMTFPKCDIVIRFDLFESQLSYAASVAHCSNSDGYLVHMVERGNAGHRRVLADITALSDDFQRWLPRLKPGSTGAIPPRSLHETLDPYWSDSDDDEPSPLIRDPTTGGIVKCSDAITVIHRLAASLQDDHNGFTIEPFFQCAETREGMRTFTISLPQPSSIRPITGPPRKFPPDSLQAACYLACSKLLDEGMLDYRMFPQRLLSTGSQSTWGDRPSTSFSADEAIEVVNTRNAAVASAGTHRYTRKRPDFWVNSSSLPRTRLYPTFVAPDDLKDEPYAPVLILTRGPLPPFSNFPLYSSGFMTNTRFWTGAPFDVTEEQYTLLHSYTSRVCRAITNKPFACPADGFPYLLAPVDDFWEDDFPDSIGYGNRRSVDTHIPWDLVKLAAEKCFIHLLPDEYADVERFVADAVIQDRRVEFTNRFYVVRVRRDMTPLSKAIDSPREAEYPSLLEYCKTRIKDFQGLKNEKQPLLEVAVAPPAINYLNPVLRPLLQSSKAPPKYLIPELCAKFTIPASTFRTMLLVPSILHRIDHQLLVKELNAHFFQHTILEEHLIAALTPPSASVAFDYERLELFGDAFLKYVASIYCFVTTPHVREGALHMARQKIISNKALLTGANRIGLPPYIQSKPFVAKTWTPITSPHSSRDPINDQKAVHYNDAVAGDTSAIQTTSKRSKKQKQQDEQNIQWLGDKTVADVVEAIIGAAYLSGGQRIALQTMKVLSVNIPGVEQWSDFSRLFTSQTSPSTVPLPTATVRAVETIVGNVFARPQLLAQALTHTSIGAHDDRTYDRLEFVGDAVLDFLVVQFIYDRNPGLSPNGLTLLKSAMVSNHALAAFCVHSGLHIHLRHAAPEVGTAVQVYVRKLGEVREKEYRLAQSERRLPGQYWLALDPPKTLSDVVESVIGALYISDDFQETSVRAFFDGTIKPFYEYHIRLQSLCPHPTTTLFELLQSFGCCQHGIAKEREDYRTRCEVVVHDVVLASALEATSAAATRTVATLALDALDGDPHFMIRTCDCRVSQQSKKARKTQKAQLGYEEDGDISASASSGKHHPRD